MSELDAERARHKSQIDVLHRAIDTAIVALEDCIHIYAAEFCDETDVEESRVRMNDGGTLWYIASVIQQCRDAKKV